MDWLNACGGVASIISLVATFYTLYKVTNLPAALKEHSREKQLTELIDKITLIPPSRRTITDSTAREVESLIRTIRLYYVSHLPFKHRTLKTLLTTLEQEIKGRKHLKEVQNQLFLIRTEIFIR